jgi:hypothetical protein
VSAYENAAWDLKFAANDARWVEETVGKRLSNTDQYEEVVPVALISDYEIKDGQRLLTEKLATKQNFRTVLEVLSGRKVQPERLRDIRNADKLKPARPEDLVLISFSSHGHTDERREFYVLPHDIGNGRGRGITKELLKKAISSEELSLWLRDVDAGEMVLVVDACHSAATVEAEGFKPGPMGSRGLGQLAYDKGMMILAASQSDDVALESERTQHGLLTYALIHDGIEAGQGDYKPRDQVITIREWLNYGVERVPKLHEEMQTGQLQTFGRGEGERGVIVAYTPTANSLKKKNAFQQPSLFDFTKGKRDVILVK